MPLLLECSTEIIAIRHFLCKFVEIVLDILQSVISSTSTKLIVLKDSCWTETAHDWSETNNHTEYFISLSVFSSESSWFLLSRECRYGIFYGRNCSDSGIYIPLRERHFLCGNLNRIERDLNSDAVSFTLILFWYIVLRLQFRNS